MQTVIYQDCNIFSTKTGSLDSLQTPVRPEQITARGESRKKCNVGIDIHKETPYQNALLLDKQSNKAIYLY